MDIEVATGLAWWTTDIALLNTITLAYGGRRDFYQMLVTGESDIKATQHTLTLRWLHISQARRNLVTFCEAGVAGVAGALVPMGGRGAGTYCPSVTCIDAD